MKPLITIKKEGQAYVDEEIVARPQPLSAVEFVLASTFGRPLPQQVVLGHERVRLRWLKATPNGLVPR